MKRRPNWGTELLETREISRYMTNVAGVIRPGRKVLSWQHANKVMNKNYPRYTMPSKLLAPHSYRTRRSVPYACSYARIADNSLMMKLEYRILLRHGERPRGIEKLLSELCPHLKEINGDSDVLTIIRCHLKQGPNNPCKGCSRILQCRHCATEFIVSGLRLVTQRPRTLYHSMEGSRRMSDAF